MPHRTEEPDWRACLFQRESLDLTRQSSFPQGYEFRSIEAGGQRRRAMTLNIDLNPTVLELANLAPSASAQGRSLVPLLTEDNPNSREVWFIEHHFPDGGWIPSSEGIRTKRWKYLRYTDSAAPFEELYDLDGDPHETNNLAGQAAYAREQAVLTGYWQKWRESLPKAGDNWREPVTAEDLRRDGL